MKIFLVCLIFLGSLLQAASFEELRQKAINENKLLWVFIETDDCSYCKKMRKELIESGLFEKEVSSKYVFAPLHGNHAEQEGFEVMFYPTSYIVKPGSKKIIEQFFGYVPAEHFISILKRLKTF